MKTIIRITTLLLIAVTLLLSCKTPVEPAPVANFTARLTQNGQVDFTNFSSNYKTLIWDFGDGERSSNQVNSVISHTYQENKTYVATLTTVNGSNISRQYSVNVVVDNVTGTLSFFLAKNINDWMEVKVYGKTEYIKGYYINGTPTCGDDYLASFYNLPTGSYTYFIRIGSVGNYQQATTVVKRGCNMVRFF